MAMMVAWMPATDYLLYLTSQQVFDDDGPKQTIEK